MTIEELKVIIKAETSQFRKDIDKIKIVKKRKRIKKCSCVYRE